jgi:predicted site-specific integrase-resolvase
VTEIASGLNEERPKGKQVLSTPKVGVLVVAQRDRFTRCGSSYRAPRSRNNVGG